MNRTSCREMRVGASLREYQSAGLPIAHMPVNLPSEAVLPAGSRRQVLSLKRTKSDVWNPSNGCQGLDVPDN